MASRPSFGPMNSGFQAGVINGPVTAQFAPQERPETPPSPLSTVPFRRDPDFVKREELLDQIHEKCSAPSARIALVGLGGVGKSQLAIAYSYETRDQSPDIWAFWIHASNAARFKQGCQEIADRLRIPGRKDPKTDILKLIHDWLQDERKGKWVLFIDNLDDDYFHKEAPSTRHDKSTSGDEGMSVHFFLSHLPPNPNGSIIVTSRNRAAASRIVEENDIIAIEPMDEMHAVALFMKKLGGQNDSEHILKLVEALDNMPLAIVQAAAHIRQRAPRFSVTRYLEEFQKSDAKKVNLLNRKGGHLRRDPEASHAVMTTWQMSFDLIQQVRPSAADLLSLMSFFDRHGIPEDLLQDRSVSGDSYEDEIPTEGDARDDSQESGDMFEDDIRTLRDFSMISIKTDGTTFEMHRLIQLATRKWLDAHGKLEQWKEQFIKNLSIGFPRRAFANWARCELLIPHVQMAVEQRPNAEAVLRDWASMLYHAAWYGLDRGTITDAEDFAVMVLEINTELFGLENKHTLDSLATVGAAHLRAGRWKEAERVTIQALKGRTQLLGPNHPATLMSMDSLASTYCHQGRWKEAENLQVQALGASKKVLGPHHLIVMATMNNLACTYRSLGRWEEAEGLQVQALKSQRQVLGPGHPDTLASVINLAYIYWAQGRWEKAEDLEAQALESQKRFLEPDHPDTLISMHNLALTWASSGKHEAAMSLMAECVRLRTQKLGPDHPHTVQSTGFLTELQHELEAQSHPGADTETHAPSIPTPVDTKP